MTTTSESQKISVQNDSKQSSSKAESAVEGSLPNVTVQPLLHAPKMWNNDSLLPAYFVTLEKYFEINNISDENMRFICLSNVMSPSQAEAHGLALSRASKNIEPYTALKNLILSSVSLECNTDWIDVLSKIEYANAQEKPSTLMSRIIAACRNNPDNDQGTRDFCEKIFMRLQPENIQQILKAQNFNSLNELGNFTNRFHSQIVAHCFDQNRTTTSEFKYLADKVDELSTELCNVKKQSQFQKPHNSSYYDKCQSKANRTFFTSDAQTYSKHATNSTSKSNRAFPQNGFCFYHAKFGNRAFKCKSFCTFRSFKNHSVTTITKTVPLTQSMILPKVYDKLSKQMFLIDSGACGNFLPASDDQAEEIESHFYDASGNPIKCFGNVTLDVDIGFGKMSDVFCICAIEQPILGFEFLRNHKITLDASTCSLKCEDSKKQVNTLQGPIDSYDSFPVHESKYTKLLQKYPALTAPVNYRKPAKHNIVHHLPTKGRPPNMKTRRVSPEKYQKIKHEIEEMVKSGLLIPSNSEFGSPLHVVPKANSTELRLVGDYKVLNKMLTPDRYPLPNLRTAYELLYGSQYFSTLDLKSAFHHISVAPEDVHKTTIKTPVGVFAFTRTPFGLSTSAQVFQRLIDTVTRGLSFVYAYINNILVFSKSEEEHYEHLTIIFDRLNDYGLTINLKKCKFGRKEIKFLGHIITCKGVLSAPEKIEAIRNFERPKSVKSLRRFTGMAQFYVPSIPNLSRKLVPLYDMIKGKRSSQSLLKWTPELVKSFEGAKDCLANYTALAFPAPHANISLVTDASNDAAGAVLQQEIDGVVQPLGFFSRIFSRTERKYAAFDKELTAIVMALKHFRYILESRNFTIYTDHKPIVAALNYESDRENARQARQLAYISEFTTDVRHLPGTSNIVDDTLSRQEINAIFKHSISIDYESLAKAQLKDEELLNFLESNHSLKIKSVPVADTSFTLLCDESISGKLRPLVPLDIAEPSLIAFTIYHIQVLKQPFE